MLLYKHLQYVKYMYMCMHVHAHILTSWYEECVSLANSTDVALRDEVTEKHLTLIG